MRALHNALLDWPANLAAQRSRPPAAAAATQPAHLAGAALLPGRRARGASAPAQKERGQGRGPQTLCGHPAAWWAASAQSTASGSRIQALQSVWPERPQTSCRPRTAGQACCCRRGRHPCLMKCWCCPSQLLSVKVPARECHAKQRGEGGTPAPLHAPSPPPARHVTHRPPLSPDRCSAVCAPRRGDCSSVPAL